MKNILILFALLFSTNALTQNWKVSQPVDDFGDPNGVTIVVGSFKGTFSNATTLNSPAVLTLNVIKDPSEGNTLSMKIIENGNKPVFFKKEKGKYGLEETKKIVLKVKKSNGDVVKFLGLGSEDTIYNFESSEDDVDSFEKFYGIVGLSSGTLLSVLLAETKPVKVHIAVSETETYLFTVDPTGLKELRR